MYDLTAIDLQTALDAQQDLANVLRNREMIIDCAQQMHSQYPQYAGHWEGAEWVLVEITRDVTTKLGLAFRAGDVTVARRHLLIPGEWTAYSIRNGIDTGITYSCRPI